MASCPSCSTPVADGAKFCPTCGSAVPQLQTEEGDPLLGKVIARNFRVESLLGTGGMGRVYKARQISLDKAVVLKVLHPHFNNDPQLVQRFQREARAASRLNHPNSISIIDFGQADDGTLFMAMELLHGKDLFTLLQEEFPIPEERLARIMVQVSSALAEAHDQNIIHRDLKPENIMVEDRRDQKDFVKVLDFGIAKIQDPSDENGRALTQQGMVCGTPEYMSPEQARGETLDARSDIYALGVLMYQMVTGDLPFKAETALGRYPNKTTIRENLTVKVANRKIGKQRLADMIEVGILVGFIREQGIPEEVRQGRRQYYLEAAREPFIGPGGLTPKNAEPPPRAAEAEGEDSFE